MESFVELSTTVLTHTSHFSNAPFGHVDDWINVQILFELVTGYHLYNGSQSCILYSQAFLDNMDVVVMCTTL